MTGQSGLPAVHEISARVTHLHFALLVPFICCATKFRQKLEIRDPLLELHGHVPIRAIMASALLWYAQRREGAFVCVCVCVRLCLCLCLWHSICHQAVLSRIMSLNVQLAASLFLHDFSAPRTALQACHKSYVSAQ